jgi:hypothetical protein
MPTEAACWSPSPSVTVATPSSAPTAMDSDSSASVVGCFTALYCAMLSTPLALSIATANAALPSSAPPEMRPTTSPPSRYSRMSWPSAVSSPESTPADATSSAYAVPSSPSAPPPLPLAFTADAPPCA